MTSRQHTHFHHNRLAHVLTFAFTISAAALSAATLYVPTNYVTIQAAINAAAKGDTVSITPGTYKENINLGGKNITIEAFNTNFDTIIDGGQLGPVVTFSGAESSKCELRDLIIRNGKATNGGGIVGNGTLATIKNCTITQNVATGDGGGLHNFDGTIKNSSVVLNLATNGGAMAGCSAFVDKCTISNNQANYAGGGIYGYGGQIQFSKITNNVAAVGGGGIAWGTGVIYRNTIEKNSVTSTGSVDNPASFGGGIVYSLGLLVSNTIRYNVSNGDGGGLAFCSEIMWNNIIAENLAKRGGGMAYCSGRFENNTVWANIASSKGGGCFQVGDGVLNSIIYANSAPTDSQWSGTSIPQYSCIQNWTGGQTDIITQDPMLVKPDDDNYALKPTSPCIDAGRYIFDLPNDYRLEPRPMNGTNFPRGDGSDFDIGADEYMPPNLNIAASWAFVNTTYTGQPGNIQGTVSAQLVVQNVGTENIVGSFNVQMFGSADAILHPNDVPLQTTTINGLAPGETKTVDFNYILPLNLIVTGYHLIAQVDPSGTLLDIFPGDNIAISAAQP